MTNPRPDPDHCLNGHDLRVCGTYVDQGRIRCIACHRARSRRSKSRKRGIMDRPFRPIGDNHGLHESAGDG